MKVIIGSQEIREVVENGHQEPADTEGCSNSQLTALRAS